MIFLFWNPLRRFSVRFLVRKRQFHFLITMSKTHKFPFVIINIFWDIRRSLTSYIKLCPVPSLKHGDLDDYSRDLLLVAEGAIFLNSDLLAWTCISERTIEHFYIKLIQQWLLQATLIDLQTVTCDFLQENWTVPGFERPSAVFFYY